MIYSHKIHKKTINSRWFHDILIDKYWTKLGFQQNEVQGGINMIAIGCDHGGYKLKEEIKKYLEEIGIEYKDFGTNSEERTDFPIYAKEVAGAVQRKECDSGILICRTGVGMSIVANKFKGVRCAACYDEATVKQAKEHSNINVLALPADYANSSLAIRMVRIWIATEFLGGKYAERVGMIEDIEKNNMK